MRLFAVLVLSTILDQSWCEECKLNKRSPEMLTEGALEAYLQSCSDLTEPPINGTSNKVHVKMGFLLQSFTFDYEEDTLTLYTWNYYSWKDNRLTWKPEDYDNLKSTHISNSVIWNPGLKLVNNADPMDYDIASFSFTTSLVNNTGNVRCVVRAEHKVFCTSVLTNWPYDTKTCLLEFAQWRLGEATVVFNLTYINYVMHSTQNSGWQIIRNKVSKSAMTGQPVIEFQMERLAEGLEATIVVPCFVISLLTVTALLLDYKKDVRLGIISLSLISHFWFTNEISISIPKYSRHVPVVLLFVSRSTILTIIVFGLSFGFRYFAKKSSLPGLWISTFNDFVFDSYGRYMIVTLWDVEEDPANCKSREWANFVNIVNSVCLLVVAITYICLFANYMPAKLDPGTDFVYV